MHTPVETLNRLQYLLAVLTRNRHDSDVVRNAVTALNNERTDWPVFRELYDRLEAARMDMWRFRGVDMPDWRLQPKQLHDILMEFREACWAARANVLNSGPLGKDRPGWLGSPLPPMRW